MTTYAERLRRRFLNTVKPIGNGIVSVAKNPIVQDVAKDALVGALMLKKGGRVPGKKGAPRMAIVHGGEYMLPAHVKPSKTQVKKVNAGKRKKKA